MPMAATLNSFLSDYHLNANKNQFGRKSCIDIRVINGKSIGPIENDLEGNYVQKISYSPDSQPVIYVKYGDLNFPPYSVPNIIAAQKGAPPLWAVSAYYAQSYPLQDFKSRYKSTASNFSIGLRYHFKQSPWALNTMFGYNQFEGKSGTFAIADLNLANVAILVRYQPGSCNMLNPYAELGPGYYYIKTDEDNFGAIVGVGGTYNPTSKISWEVGGYLQQIFSGQNDRFIQIRAGAVYRF